jgi:hypothetical protein
MADRITVDQWRGQFFDWYFRANPVSATFIGVHTYDHELPQPGWHGVEAGLADLLEDLERDRITEPGEIDDVIDLRLAGSFLRVAQAELQSAHLRLNPCYYTGESVFGVVSLFLRDFAPIDYRLDAAGARLRKIPDLLNAGTQTIDAAPDAWVERAIRECEGAERFLRDGLPLLISRATSQHPDLMAARDMALSAFEAFRDELMNRSADGERRSVGLGREQFDWLLREAHFLDMSGSEIVSYARAELETARSALVREMGKQGFADWSTVSEAIANEHPTAGDYLGRFQQVWDDARQYAVDRELLTWPEFPIVFEPIPDWAASASPSLYFLFYRCPPPFADGQVQRYLVTPLGDEPERVLRAVNETQITLNHVIHHAGIGHHVQNWHAARAGSRIGQMAGNDCALRIAMPSAGTLVEGWACYATDLMEEAGYLTPLQRLSMLNSRMRMAARAVVDVELHAGRFSLDDAVDYYVREVDMSPGAAQAEAVKNSMFPTMAMMYLIGTDMIHELRSDMQRIWGSDFSLRRFHDEFLSWGAIPVAMIGRLMRAEPLEPSGLNR